MVCGEGIREGVQQCVLGGVGGGGKGWGREEESGGHQRPWDLSPKPSPPAKVPYATTPHLQVCLAKLFTDAHELAQGKHRCLQQHVPLLLLPLLALNHVAGASALTGHDLDDEGRKCAQQIAARGNGCTKRWALVVGRHCKLHP